MLKFYPVSQKVAQDALRVAEEIARKDSVSHGDGKRSAMRGCGRLSVRVLKLR